MKMRTREFIKIMAAAGLAGVLLASGAARGQGQTWAGGNLQQMVEAARWRAGVFRLNAAFTLSNTGYDSDIYYGFLAERVPDVTSSASTPVQVLLPLSKKAVIDLSDSPEYVFYLDTPADRAWNNTFSGRVHIALDRVYFQAGGGISNVRRRLSPELEFLVRQNTTSANGLILWQASKSTSMALLYGGAQYDYGDAVYQGTSIADRLNRNEEYLDLISYIQPSARVRLSFDGQYGSYQFRRSGTLRDAVSYGAFAGVELIPSTSDFELLRGARGTASLGYMRVDMQDPGLADGSGLVGTGRVMARLSKRMTGELFFSRGFQFSIYSGASFYLETSAGATLTRLLSRRAGLSYSFSYGSTSYPGFGSGAAGRYYRYLTHGLSLDVRLARYLDVAFMGSFGQRDPGGSMPVRDRFFAGISLVYGVTGSGMSAPRRGGTR